jgi:hypothetical protein
MALLLSLVLVANWIASITLVPILVSYVKPKFVTRHGAPVSEEVRESGELRAVRS